jgi:IS605 OrfB family transposase
MILTYKYRLKGKRTVRQLRRFAFAANQVWNFCVATQKDTQRRWKNGGKSPWLTHYDLVNLTKGTSKDLGIHAQSITSICDQFTKSRDASKKTPRFRKSFGPKHSLGWIPFQRQSRQVDGNSITYLGNVYRFFGAKRRPLPAIVKGGAFVEDSQGRWYVTLHVEVDELPTGSGAVGIDLGLKTLATTSDGYKIEAPQHYRKYQEKLATAQRAGSKRRVKAIHAKIKNSRQDHLHKESNKLAKRYGLIVVGNVSSSKLAKTKMAKSIYDAGWSTFKEMLRYKVSRHGATFLEVDEKFTSQRCSSCEEIPHSSPKGMGALGIREWECSGCGARHDRDVNAARNILRLALSAQRPAEGSREVA